MKDKNNGKNFIKRT